MKTDKLLARDASIKRITELLTPGPMSAYDLANRVTVTRSTLYDHLNYMHKELRTARPLGFRNRSMVWSLGADPALGPLVSAALKRDPLVAAFFGPAHPNT